MRQIKYFAFVILLLCACAGAQQHPGLQPYTPTRIDWLTLTLEAALRDDSMADGYLLEITSSDPETIVIYVRYTSKVDRQAMNIAIDAATKVIHITAKSYGWDTWVKIREDLELTR